MENDAYRALVARAMAIASVVGFLCLTFWLGFGLSRRQGQESATEIEAQAPAQDDLSEGLQIVGEPSILAKDDKLEISWVTSLPADSLVLYGREDPFERVAIKDRTLVKVHRFELPALPGSEAYLFRVVSVDSAGRLVSGFCRLAPRTPRQASEEPPGEVAPGADQ